MIMPINNFHHLLFRFGFYNCFRNLKYSCIFLLPFNDDYDNNNNNNNNNKDDYNSSNNETNNYWCLLLLLFL